MAMQYVRYMHAHAHATCKFYLSLLLSSQNLDGSLLLTDGRCDTLRVSRYTIAVSFQLSCGIAIEIHVSFRHWSRDEISCTEHGLTRSDMVQVLLNPGWAWLMEVESQIQLCISFFNLQTRSK